MSRCRGLIICRCCLELLLLYRSTPAIIFILSWLFYKIIVKTFWLFVSVTISFLKECLITRNFTLKILFYILHPLLKVHFCNYACLTSFCCKWRLACICTCATIFAFVSKRLVNCLGSKPIACVRKWNVKCWRGSLYKRCWLVYSCILVPIELFLILGTFRNR